MTRIVCGFVLAALLTGAGAGPAQEKDKPAPKGGPLAKAAGTWKLVALEEAGKDALTDDVKGRTITFDGKKFAMQREGVVLWQGNLTVVDGKANPIQIDQGSETGAGKGENRQCIWKFEGDKLHIAGGYKDAARPTDFKTRPGDPWTYAVFERVPAPKK